MKNISRKFALIVLALTTVYTLQAQGWNVPDDAGSLSLGVDYNADNQAAGKTLFSKNACSACHSVMAAADKNERALPLAPNLGAMDIQNKNTDGEFFYKIKHGGGNGMPPFAQLSDDDVWKIVTYIRSFNASYTPPERQTTAPAAATAKFEGTVKGIDVDGDADAATLTVRLKAVDADSKPVAANGVAVDVFVKRYFGMLKISPDGSKTDENGVLKVEYPEGLTGNEKGEVSVVARLTSNEAVSVSKTIDMKVPLHWENPLNKRHVWGTAAKAPLWILISYLSVVIGVWLTIFWAILQLARIYSLRER